MVYTHNTETFGPNGALGRDSDRDVVVHDQWDSLDRQVAGLRAARDLRLPRLMSGELAA